VVVVIVVVEDIDDDGCDESFCTEGGLTAVGGHDIMIFAAAGLVESVIVVLGGTRAASVTLGIVILTFLSSKHACAFPRNEQMSLLYFADKSSACVCVMHG
jgi:hypothetical protein